jgi:hypothetical protein
MARLAQTSMLLLWAVSGVAFAQDNPVLCADGEGKFSARFETGVTVTVGATKQHELGERTCEAALVSGGIRLTVVEGAAEADVDVMGADLGLGTPVVAVQFRRSELDHRTTYEIYSLEKKPRLMRTLTGSAYFSAADYKLAGKIDIRTVDAGAVDGFEGIPLGSFGFVPPVFLRFENHKLLDVSAEYRQDFDQRIAELRTGMDRATLAEFKQSDGALASGFRMPMEQFRALIAVKIRVMEVVWAYLYSGREDEAWQALDEMWPAPDVNRMRVAMLDAQKRGIRAQVDEVSTSGPRKTKQLRIFEPATAQPTNRDSVGLPGGVAWQSAADRMRIADSNPAPIDMHEQCASVDCSQEESGPVLMDFVVDDAGKVRSAKFVAAAVHGPTYDALLKAALGWKFIPAYKMGQPVACEMQMTVSPNQ